MGRGPKFAIVYAPEVRRQVDAIPPKFHSEIRRAITQRLTTEPGHPKRNREPLEEPHGASEATWELRCGAQNEFRVFYEIDAPMRQVLILVIGVKDRSRLLIAGEEFGL